jgi:hypothetical protein
MKVMCSTMKNATTKCLSFNFNSPEVKSETLTNEKSLKMALENKVKELNVVIKV